MLVKPIITKLAQRLSTKCPHRLWKSGLDRVRLYVRYVASDWIRLLVDFCQSLSVSNKIKTKEGSTVTLQSFKRGLRFHFSCGQAKIPRPARSKSILVQILILVQLCLLVSWFQCGTQSGFAEWRTPDSSSGNRAEFWLCWLDGQNWEGAFIWDYWPKYILTLNHDSITCLRGSQRRRRAAEGARPSAWLTTTKTTAQESETRINANEFSWKKLEMGAVTCRANWRWPSSERWMTVTCYNIDHRM